MKSATCQKQNSKMVLIKLIISLPKAARNKQTQNIFAQKWINPLPLKLNKKAFSHHNDLQSDESNRFTATAWKEPNTNTITAHVTATANPPPLAQSKEWEPLFRHRLEAFSIPLTRESKGTGSATVRLSLSDGASEQRSANLEGLRKSGHYHYSISVELMNHGQKAVTCGNSSDTSCS